MPKCGSQVVLCDLPVRFDTYKGCSHGCVYCFAQKKANMSDIKPYESVFVLKNFIEGKRGRDTSWCDWDIPLHWGGMSDPFQPCLLYTSDAADDLLCVDLGGRRIIKKNTYNSNKAHGTDNKHVPPVPSH